MEVNYQNAVDENESFMGTIAPQLSAGLDTGWDLIVLTDWMASRVVAAGWAEKIDHNNTPTAVANVRDELAGFPWDPNFDFHFPWQSFSTGVGFNVGSTQRELTKIADLFDPAFAGKVTLLSDPHDSFPLVHLMLQAQGKASATPAEAMTVEDGQVVHDFLKPYVDSAHIRKLHRQRLPAGLRQRRHLGGLRLVRRPRLVGRGRRPVRVPRRGLVDRDRQHDHPQGRAA